MKENTNKAIALNSIILYVRLLLTSIFALLTTRFALNALGVDDFGLFAVLGSIISFIGIFNTIMLSTSNRFIAVAIGKGDLFDVNEQFNVNLIIHIIIAAITLLLSFPLGDWYIHNYVQYDGDINDAIRVFKLCILGSVFSFIGVPYNGLLMAKEKFIVFSLVDVFANFAKMAVSLLIVYYFSNKLLIYTISQAILTAIPTFIYYLYCKSQYTDIVKFRISYNKQKYKEVFNFSMWIAYGAIATIGKTQGAALLVNAFFNTMMNTALGIANSVNSLIITFAQNVSQPIAPQITKSYVSGNKERCDQLLIMSTKTSFFVMFLISSPFLLSPNWIFGIWLGQVPPYVIHFTTLLIADALISSLNSGISSIIFASGRIKLYQVSINTLRFFAIVAAFFVLKLGGPVYSLLLAYIFFSIIIFFVGQWVLNKTLNYDNSLLIKHSYAPSIIIVIVSLPIFLFTNCIPDFPRMIIGFIYILFVEIAVGFSKKERNYMLNYIKLSIKGK